MFGAYQAGVWDVLRPALRPDLVIGCSVGSINGWAIASDVPGDELIGTWLDPRCAGLMRPRVPYRPWRSYFDPAPLQELVLELTSRYTPRVPFVVAVTRLPLPRLEFTESPDWRHIMASCAVPLAYPRVRIDGRSYCDGGLLNIMPAWIAPRYGADRVITVNVLPSMPLNVIRSTVRMVRLLAPREPELTGVEAFHLGPERVMGTLHQALSWQPECIRRWIDRGRADAEALIASPQFAASALSQPRP
jgi:NTE family protein